MKNQALFSSKDKSKNLECHLLQFLFGTLKVNTRYSVTCKVYRGYHATKEIKHSSSAYEIKHCLSACTVDNPLAKDRAIST